jgi:uncharacterized membrane protein required for colicin V production
LPGFRRQRPSTRIVTKGDSLDLGAFLSGFTFIDLLLILFFMGFFVLGFAQGTIRRLIGLGSVLFSFLFAASLSEALGSFLGSNWTQFAREYSYMIGFGTIFVAAAIAFALVAQGFYKPQPLFEKSRFVDEILGGILGLIQFGLILLSVVVILDSFFTLRGIAPDPQEMPALRELWNALDSSNIVDFFRSSVIPGFLSVFDLFIPDRLIVLYPGRA